MTTPTPVQPEGENVPSDTELLEMSTAFPVRHDHFLLIARALLAKYAAAPVEQGVPADKASLVGHAFKLAAQLNNGSDTAEIELRHTIRLLAASPTPPVSEGQDPVGKVRHFMYSGIARNGGSVEAVLNDGVVLPEGTLLYTHPAPQAAPVTHWPDGTARDPRDIASDPGGVLVHEPGKPLIAAKPAQDEREAFPEPMPTFADDDEGRRAFVLGWNGCLNVARAALSTPPMEGDALTLRFIPASKKLPDLVDHSTSYGGQWSSAQCAVITSDGYVRTDRLTVGKTLYDAISAGESEYVQWRAGFGQPKVLAWVDQAEVNRLVAAIAAMGGPKE